MHKKIIALELLRSPRVQEPHIIRITDDQVPTVITFNSGSSSLKMSVVQQGGKVIMVMNCENIGTPNSKISFKDCDGTKESIVISMPDHRTAIKEAIALVKNRCDGLKITAVGHRVVHGGKEFKSSVKITPDVVECIRHCSSLAPLHNPPNLVGIESALQDPFLSDLPQIAVFDTSFHANMPHYAKWYAVPKEWRENDDIEKYGFHGTSYEYVKRMFRVLRKLNAEENNLVIAHLGNGCSMSMVQGNIGVDTSMGLTPLEGLIMGTRSGDLDPGILLGIMEKKKLSAQQMSDILNKKSGLLGLYNGKDKEMQTIRTAAANGDIDAEETINVVTYRIASYFSRYLGLMREPKGLVFTAGIGENESVIRNEVLRRMRMYNWQINAEHNYKRGENVCIAESATIPGLQAWVIPTNEELIYAEDTLGIALNGKVPEKYSFEK